MRYLKERGEKSRENRMAGVLRRMEKLAAAPVNDAVKLAFLDSSQVEQIDGLDLSALTEFKRSGNGGVEIRLTDRMAVLERVAALLSDQDDRAEEFFRAMEGKEGA